MASDINVADTLAEIRGRVSARLARTVPEIPELTLPPLDPLRQARTVAQGWAGSMGAVNPRPPGLLNGIAQSAKTLLARSLRWFAFPQTQFNSGAVAAMVRTEEMFADMNRNMVVLGQNLVDRQRKDAELERRIERSDAELESLRETSTFVMNVLREQIDSLERRQSETFDEMSRSVSLSFEEMHKSIGTAFSKMYGDIARMDASLTEVQDRFWRDFKLAREGVDAELRLVRQRLLTVSAPAPVAVPATAAQSLPSFDYSHFEQRFRGKEEDIRKRQRFYLPMLRDQAPVLDIACGRGEMLELLREQGIESRGVDLDADMVARCHTKDLPVERADALAYLEKTAEASLGAVFSAQFVEHLPIAVYNRLIELAYSRLRAGGRLILETQNPECLAIFSQSFYLDPTHVRPVPPEQLRFLLEEAGFRDIKVHFLSPVTDAGLPQLPAPDEATRKFNETFFGYMDYGITGVKP